MKEDKLDYEAFKREAIEKLRNKEPGITADSLFRPLFKQFIEEALEAEMDEHLTDQERGLGNRKNGKNKKTVKSSHGSFEMETPRDRSGTFDPKLVGKRQTLISSEIEDKVLRLYSKGMSTVTVQSFTTTLTHTVNVTAPPTATTSIMANTLNATDVLIYPNPAHEIVNIDLRSIAEPVELSITDVSGRELKRITVKQSTKLNIKELEPGAYVIKLFSKNRLLKTHKLIKE